MMPGGAGEVEIKRQPGTDDFTHLRIMERIISAIAVFADPAGRSEDSGGVEPKPLMPLIIQNILIQPVQFRSISGGMTA